MLQDIKLLECPICQYQLRDPVTIQCGHTFCYQCMSHALSTIPRCPLCRLYVQIKPDQFKINIILSSMIRSDQTTQQPKKISINNCIVVYTNSPLFAYSYQKIEVNKYQAANLTTMDYVSHFTDTNVFVYNTNSKVSLQAQIKRIQFSHNNIIATILTQDPLSIQSITTEPFTIDSADQLGVKEKKNIILPVGQGQIQLQDEELNLEDLHQIGEIKLRINNFLEKVFNQHNLLDSVEQEVYQKLVFMGLFNYLQDTDVNSIRKLSHCLPSILKISINKKQQLLKLSILNRLIQSEKLLKQLSLFNHGGMIFDLPNDHPQPPFLQLFVLLCLFILYLTFN